MELLVTIIFTALFWEFVIEPRLGPWADKKGQALAARIRERGQR